MKNLVIFLLIALLGYGCATPYQSSGLSGGYSETQLDENVFKVSFSGNGYTATERAVNFTLLRSAELTLEHGYKYFVIVDEDSHTTTSTHTTPLTTYAYGNGTATTYGGDTQYISKPQTSNTIVCYQEKPQNSFSCNAEIVKINFSKKYEIDEFAE